MSPPKVHDEAMRTALLMRAAELLSLQGPDALSLRRLAKDVGTSTTAVYSLFGSKAALFDALYHEAVLRFAAALSKVLPSDDPAADVVEIGIAYRAYALTDPHFYEIIFNRTWTEGSEIAGEAAQTFQPLLDTVLRGQESRHFRAAPPESIALSCWAAAHGLVTLELHQVLPEGVSVGDHYVAMLSAVVDGWRAKPAEILTA